jgi:beta-phosphoglucomutase-like phosphatase (HAD superfamily)
MLADLIPRLGLAYDVEYYVRETREAEIRAFSGPLELPAGRRCADQRLADHGVPRAVGSSNDHAWVDRVLTGLGVREHFPVIVGGAEVEHGKPAPEIFLRCAELLREAPARSAVIEDSLNGILAARAAGMTAIGLRTAASSTLALDGCLAVVDTFAEAAIHLGVAL